MRKSGGAVILMQLNLTKENNMDLLNNIKYFVGSKDTIINMSSIAALQPFNDKVINFLNLLSKIIITSKAAKEYPDIVTLGFWMRKSAVLKLKERIVLNDDNISVGRGIAFHVAPANVPVNYMYSLVIGLLTGNANIVRMPTKDFPQVSIINKAVNEALNEYPEIKKYICIIRYERNNSINDLLSYIADTRIIWGGDNTISELRKSSLQPRATEITFADRYSIAVIDSDKYMCCENKQRIAEEFYNDTFLTDQNACTSPRLIVWLGNQKKEAKEIFWEEEHKLVKKKYNFQPIMAINKLTTSYIAAINKAGTKIEKHKDNLIIRVNICDLDKSIMDIKDNSGYFYEYECDNIMDLYEICNDKRCQTMGLLGEINLVMPLLLSGIKGIDRVVPIGKTMDFDVIWDGVNLYERLTRTIAINI